MPRTNLPSYRLHKPTGQAIVSLRGNIFYLGKYKSKASREKYTQIIAEYTANDCRLPPTRSRTEITIEELVIRFLEFAEGYYGIQTRTLNHCQNALAPVVQYYGSHRVSDFGPLSLKFIREKWIEARHSRSTISKRVGIIKQAFRWGVENEMVTPRTFFNHSRRYPVSNKGEQRLPNRNQSSRLRMKSLKRHFHFARRLSPT